MADADFVAVVKLDAVEWTSFPIHGLMVTATTADLLAIHESAVEAAEVSDPGSGRGCLELEHAVAARHIRTPWGQQDVAIWGPPHQAADISLEDKLRAPQRPTNR
jgi:hypothetical protein